MSLPARVFVQQQQLMRSSSLQVAKETGIALACEKERVESGSPLAHSLEVANEVAVARACESHPVSTLVSVKAKGLENGMLYFV